MAEHGPNLTPLNPGDTWDPKTWGEGEAENSLCLFLSPCPHEEAQNAWAGLLGGRDPSS